jgi:twitching motility two-component system response regulator PilH
MAKILVVDDVQTDREILGKIVTKMGHVPIYAGDGARAVAMAREEQPALILLDVVMPEMDGFKVVRTIRHDPAIAKIPVVLVTTKGGESDKFWGRKQGADDHVPKPYTVEAMEAVIRRYAQ